MIEAARAHRVHGCTCGRGGNKRLGAKPTITAGSFALFAGARSRSDSSSDEGPIYQVFLPPMRFDANLKVQQPPDPNLIVLVRRVRVRPTLIFEGRVEGDALIAESRPAVAVAAASKPNPASRAATGAPATNPTVADRVRTLWKRMWGPKS